jgi:5'-3' exonuclease
MGVQGFYKLIKKHGFLPEHVTTLDGRKIGIDGRAMLYAVSYGIAADATHQVMIDQVTSRTIRMLKKLSTAIGDTGTIVFVVDGKIVPIEKQRCASIKRSKARSASKLRLTTAISTAAKSTTRITKETHDRIDRMKRATRGLPQAVCNAVVGNIAICGEIGNLSIQIAPSEADFVLNQLFREKTIDLVATDDADIIVAGSTIIRGLTKHLGVCGTPIDALQLYSNARVCTALGLVPESLLQLACLLGTDYVLKPCGVGPVTALKAIHKYKSVAGFIMSWSSSSTKKKCKFTLPPGYLLARTYLVDVDRSCVLISSESSTKTTTTKRSRVDDDENSGGKRQKQ